MAATASEPGHLHFDISDLLEEESEGKRSFDVEESYPLNSSHGAAKKASIQSFYRPVQDHEGYHRYDPRFRWSQSAERNLVRKVIVSSDPTYRPNR